MSPAGLSALPVVPPDSCARIIPSLQMGKAEARPAVVDNLSKSHSREMEGLVQSSQTGWYSCSHPPCLSAVPTWTWSSLRVCAYLGLLPGPSSWSLEASAMESGHTQHCASFHRDLFIERFFQGECFLIPEGCPGPHAISTT